MEQMDNSDTNDVELDGTRDPVADRRSFIKRMAMVAGATAAVPAIASFALGSSSKPRSVAVSNSPDVGAFTNGASNTTPVIVFPSTTTTEPATTTTTPTPTTTLPPSTTTTTTIDTAGSGGIELPPTE